MREILFRGKRVDNGEWVFGFYYYSVRYGSHFIKVSLEDKDTFIECDVEVHPETVGQFTGLLDKNGKKIFEGDVCKTYECGYGFNNDAVVFEDGAFVFQSSQRLSIELRGYKRDYIEIIGNIHDNPGLT